MFDSRETFPLTSRLLGGDFNIRWPSDADWNEYSKGIQAEFGPSGERGLSKSTTKGEETAAKTLVDKVVIGEREFDADECTVIVAKLSELKEVETRREAGNVIRVRMGCFPGVEVEHEVKMPSVKQLRRWATQNAEVGQRGATVVARSNYIAGEAFYDALAKPVDGYVEGSALPITHKEGVAQAVYNLIKEEEGGLPF